jgi:hypothetical protein
MKKIFLLFFLMSFSLGFAQNTPCSGFDTEASQGSFITGYNYNFSTSGTDVTIEFELLDNRDGVVAYAWTYNPNFAELGMNLVSGKKFKRTFNGQVPGSTFTVACKFAFAGGLAVTKQFTYTVGDNCSGGGGDEDTEAPTNFSASIGAVTSNSVELLLNGEDNSGLVTYNVNYGSGSTSTTSVSGTQKSLVINNLSSDTLYNFNIQASDASGNTSVNNPIILQTTTLENANTACSGFETQSDQGSFETGYNYHFTTSGTDVTVEFEMLDNRSGVVAYAWTYNPNFAETGMNLVSGRKFTKTFSGQAPGSTFKVACKFAYAGGLAVTKTFTYIVGDNCSGGGGDEDTEAPTNFTASVGEITSNSVELLLNGEDNSGLVTYSINYGSGSTSTTGVSGVQKSFIISNLSSDTLYNFSIGASDETGNSAANNPIVLQATTLVNTNTACSGFENQSNEGSFTIGYNYHFTTSGTDVTVEFELLDERSGVVAYAFTYNPNFAETGMSLVSGRKFTRTFSGQTPGSTFKVACKFAYAGGLAVTKQFTYTVGDNCNGGGGDLPLPTYEPWSIASKQVGDDDFEITPPVSTSSGSFTYQSSNTSVATIVNDNEIHIIGGGTTTITAIQSETEEYSSGSTTAVFTVTIPPLTVAAPMPPARNTWDVISVFSDAYTPVLGQRDYNPNWGQSGFANFDQPLIDGNQTLKYSGVNYQGIDIGSTIEAINAGMTHIHIDIYTTDCPSTDFRLVENGQDRSKVLSTPVGVWNSFDIPLSEFPGLNGNLISQLKFQRDPFGATSEWYIDNIYFYRPATLLTPTITDFAVPTKALGDDPFALTAPTSNSLGEFTYTSSNESVATINGDTVTIIGTGTTTITAIQAANGDYDSGSVSAQFNVVVPIIPVSITSPLCGTTLNQRNAAISCNSVSILGHEVKYRFRIHNENFNVSVTRDVPNFTLQQASYAAYVHPAAATYDVYVALVVDGELQPESLACPISVVAAAAKL